MAALGASIRSSGGGGGGGGEPLGYLQGTTVLYELEDPETSIGRGEDNDIVRVAMWAWLA